MAYLCNVVGKKTCNRPRLVNFSVLGKGQKLYAIATMCPYLVVLFCGTVCATLRGSIHCIVLCNICAEIASI